MSNLPKIKQLKLPDGNTYDLDCSSTFEGLTDVDIDDQTLADGQVPIYDSTSTNWVNKTTDVTLTQAEYDALVANDEVEAGVDYHISDGMITCVPLDDNEVSQSKTWSSDKIYEEILDLGEIKAFMRTTAPTGYLSCDGTTYNIGDYPLLEALFTADFGAVNYFGGDGATTWKVPDLRGEFLRGTGTNGHSGQGNGANVGTHQDGTKQPGVFGNEWNVVGCQDAGTNYDWESGSTLARTYTGRTGVDTAGFSFIARPTNTSVLYCIRAY